MRVCSVHGCPEIYDGKHSRCATHRRVARARRTGNRVYSTPAHRAFRAAVIQRDPICVACGQAFSTVADHYPRDRRTLVDLGMNPNDPKHGRGLCAPCHNKHTAATTPGGFRAD